RDFHVTGVQTCALPISRAGSGRARVDPVRHRAPRAGLRPRLPGLPVRRLRMARPGTRPRRVVPDDAATAIGDGHGAGRRIAPGSRSHDDMETRMNPTRRNRRRFTALLAALGAGAVAPLGTASAADWPTRPVKLIVPYSAGGPTDAIARLLAEHMSRSLGEAVVVENLAGAGGTIGVGAMLNAAPDGHTIALVAPGPLAGMPNLTRTTYSADDMDFLTLVARIPSVL